MEKNLVLDQCFGCPLEKRKLVPFIGPRTSKLAVVDEYVSYNEAKKGEPFTGRAGQLLDAILESMNLSRADIRLGNAILCGPFTDEDKTAKWLPEVVERCARRCHAAGDLGEAKVVVTLGGTGAWGVLGRQIVLGGKWPERGAIHRDRDGRIVIPTWNPAAILKAGGSDTNSRLSDADAETISLDILRGWRLSTGEIQEFKPRLQLISDPKEFTRWCNESDWRVAIDVETDGVDPITCKLLSVGLARRYPPRDPVSFVPQRGIGSDVLTLRPADKVEAISFWWPNADAEAVQALKDLLDNGLVDKTWHNCLTDDSRVWMADGTHKSLGEIVRKKLPGPVLSVNPETGAVEIKRIVGWVHNPVRPWKDWRRIRVRGKGCLRITRDHRVRTSGSWKQAGLIRVGDRIRSRLRAMNFAERALIFGSLLGDMSVYPAKFRSAFLAVAHEQKQVAYLRFKAACLAEFRPREECSVRYGGFSARNGTRMHRVTTHRDPRLNEVADICLLRGQGRKRLTQAWLNELTLPALAIWFCDDGSVCNADNGRSFSMQACVTAIGESGRRLLIRHLRRRGWPACPWTRKDGQLYISIAGPRRRGLDPVMHSFWSDLAPFVPRCMAYKLPVRYRTMASDAFWVAQYEASPWYDEVVEVGPLRRKEGDRRRYGGYTPRPGKLRGLGQYCIEVEDNHNFFAEGLLVANCSFDAIVLERILGVRIRGGRSDTMLLSHARFPDVRVNLADVGQTWLAIPPWKHEYHTRDRKHEKDIEQAQEKGYKIPTWSKDRVLSLLEYNAMDAAVTIGIEPPLVGECERERLLEVAATDVALSQEAQRMQEKGVLVDVEVREKLRKDTETRLATAEERLNRMIAEHMRDPADRDAARKLDEMLKKNDGKINYNSGPMLNLAFDVCGVEVPAIKGGVTKTGQRALNKKVLAAISDHPLVAALYACRGVRRVKNVFFTEGKGVMVLGPDGRLHIPWKVHGTPTGRWASGADKEDEGADDVVSINLQNWPEWLRAMVVAPPGYAIVGADFCQLEYRAISLLAGERPLLDLFNDPSQPDLHNMNCSRLYGLRWDALDPDRVDNPFEKEKMKKHRKALRAVTKNGLYGAMYLGSRETIQLTIQSRALRESDDFVADTFRRITKAQCQEFVDAIPRLWPSIERWRRWAVADAEENHEVRTPLSGRRRIWPLGMVDATQAVNTRIQSIGGDVMNARFLELQRRLPPEARIILQVHDSVDVECPQEMAQDVYKLMVDTLTTTVTLPDQFDPSVAHSCIFSVDAKIGHAWNEV